MKAKEIQELIDFIANSGLEEVNIETDNFKISVKRNTSMTQEVVPVQVTTKPAQNITPVVQAQASTPAVTPQSNTNPSQESDTPTDESNYIKIKSPMIGTFYRSSNPDSAPFVNVGDTIEKGKVICIVEAMKLFNEIEAEVSGRVVKVLVDNASPVEYDQPLFLVEPI